jgi:hypothetical protein
MMETVHDSIVQSHYEPGTTHFGLFAGFMIFAVVEAWTPICGCLLNPAAVIGFYIAGRMSFARGYYRVGTENFANVHLCKLYVLLI